MAAAAVLSDRVPHQLADEEDGYFNDLTQETGSRTQNIDNSDEIPKAKRIACVLCRKRKLKCDGARPSCGTCSRLSHDCSYDEVRKKSGPRRGYVRQLEARLAQVETLLKSGDPPSKSPPTRSRNESEESPDFMNDVTMDPRDSEIPNRNKSGASGPDQIPHYSQPSLEIMNLGLDEPLPTQDVVDDLNRLFFEKVYPLAPAIHKARFYAAMSLPPQSRPPVALRYAMWAFTASVVDKYEDLQDHFYKRARKYIERDEMHGHGENIITVQHVQAWYLISMLEFKMTYFPRAWMSTGRAARLATMMGLHRLDNVGLDVKQCLPPPKDWTDREERRRTFWMCFIGDRFASIGTGWPMSFDEADIHTNLPVDDESFEMSREKQGIPLSKALNPDGAINISSIAGVVVMGCLFGRNLHHLHRSNPDDGEKNLNGKFWSRHRTLDNTLLNISLSLPGHLRLPAGISDQNTIFLNLCIHTSTICLHQAAIFKADSNKLPANIAAESKVRCITAAAEIASIMRMISHMDLTNTNPFATFCLYVAARVFVQYLKSRPKDNNVQASLHFLLTAMQAMRRKNLLTESLLVQLDIDLQGAGLEESRTLRNRLAKMNVTNNIAKMRCPMEEERVRTALNTEQEQPARHQYTFGNSGISSHTDPAETNMRGVNLPNPRINSVSDSGHSPMSKGSGNDNTRVRFMPTRTKTPSTRPSPATVSDEVMDLTFDSVDSASPGSFNMSSHTSTTSQTPPMFHHDSQNSILTAASTANSMNINLDTMSNEEFQNMMGQYTNIVNNSDTSSFKDPNVSTTAVMSGNDDNAFTMPFFDGSQDLLTENFPSGTGFTPAPSGDLLNISDTEWKQIVDSGMLDMGWEGLSAGKTMDLGR